jgi:porphobilinogen synthase
MPGIHRFSPDQLVKDVAAGLKSGVNKILLFGVGDEKSEDARSSYSEKSVVAESIKLLKKEFKNDLLYHHRCLCLRIYDSWSLWNFGKRLCT